MQNQTEIKSAFNLLLLASAITLLLWFIPFAEVITYPIRLFVTFIHEGGHALATLMSLGHVNRIELYANGSGVTETIGGFRLLISSAGYLSTMLYGAMLLLLLRKQASGRSIAIVTAILMVLLTVFWGGNWLMWLTGIILGVGFLALGVKAKPSVTHFVMSFLAVQCVLNAFYDLRTLLYLSTFSPSTGTDAVNMTNATGGFIPPVFWAIIWGIISVLMLGVTLIVYHRSMKAKSKADALDMPAALLPDSFDKIMGNRV